MGPLAAGEVVLVAFPFSDLSQTKLRPAIVLADAGEGDWVLCQITTSPYSDPSAVTLSEDDFSSGSLLRESFARPAKLFTAHRQLIDSIIGTLKSDAFERVINGIVQLLRDASKTMNVAS